MKKWRKILGLLLCAAMILNVLQCGIVFADEAGSGTVVKLLYTDEAGAGLSISAWGGAQPAENDMFFKKEGSAALKLVYGADANQSTAAFFFSPSYVLEDEMKETGVLQFWYYSEMDIPQLTLAFTSPMDDGSQAECRVALKDKYLNGADVGQWTLVQVPLADFPETGQAWNGTAFDTVEFDFANIDKLVFYANTKGITTTSPIYIDSLAIMKDVEIVEKTYPKTDYYVSPNGSDSNDGKSPDRPLKTPQKAADKTNPGDTVYFMGGTFEINSGLVLNIKRSGAEGAYITYTTYKDEKPVFKAGGNVWNAISIQASYIILDGLTLVGINDEITLEEGWDSYYAVLKKQDTGESYDDAAVARTNTNAISFSGREGVDAGQPPLHHIEIRNCDVSKFPACGIGGSGCDYVIIENNKVYDNMWYSLWGSSGISFLCTVDWDENYEDYKIIVRNNLVYNNKNLVKCQNGRKWSDGNGIIIDYNKNTGHEMRPPYKGMTLIENNIVYENGGGGIHLFNSSNIDVINNTCYDNGQASYENGLVDYDGLHTQDLTHWGNISIDSCTNVRVINNIAVGEREKTTTLGYGSKNNNVFYANNIHYNFANPENDPSKNGSNMVPDDRSFNNIWADPQFADLSKRDFHLTAASPAVDFGTKTLAAVVDYAGDKRPQGANFDLGAYESTFTSATPAKDNDLNLEELMASQAAAPVETAQAAKGTPIIDAIIDDIWVNTELFATHKFAKGDKGATGTIRTMWDENYLYVLADVKDANLNAVNEQAWNQDSIEFFIDEDCLKSFDYLTDDAQYRVNFKGEKTVGTNGDLENFKAAVIQTADGYCVEAAIPFRTTKGQAEKKIGFDIQINDDQGSGATESQAKWSDAETTTHKDTSRFGNLTLVDAYLHQESADETVIKVSIDGVQLNFPDVLPFILEGRTLVPLRAIFEGMGAQVEWDEAERKVTGTKDGITTVLYIDNKIATVNGVEVELDVPAMISDSRTMVPARFIAESLGAKVEWVPEKSLVLINTK